MTSLPGRCGAVKVVATANAPDRILSRRSFANWSTVVFYFTPSAHGSQYPIDLQPAARRIASRILSIIALPATLHGIIIARRADVARYATNATRRFNALHPSYQEFHHLRTNQFRSLYLSTRVYTLYIYTHVCISLGLIFKNFLKNFRDRFKQRRMRTVSVDNAINS